MKKTTCHNLKGACQQIITGETPEQMGENSRAHVMEMVKAGDKDHLAAIEEMKQLSPEEQQKWYRGFVESFDDLEEA